VTSNGYHSRNKFHKWIFVLTCSPSLVGWCLNLPATLTFWGSYEMDFPERRMWRPRVEYPLGPFCFPFLELSFFYRNPLSLQSKKEDYYGYEKVNDGFFGILMISSFVLVAVIQAGAETLKFKATPMWLKQRGPQSGMWMDTLWFCHSKSVYSIWKWRGCDSNFS